MAQVTSRNVAAVGYDGTTGDLNVEFRNGRVYAYANVPAEVHAALMSARSKGTYFYYAIRFRYPCRRLR